MSLLEAVTAGVEPGSAGEARGLITGLRYLVGEASLDEATGGRPVLSRDGTGVVRLAQIRLEEGAYAEADRAEIERRLAILLPSQDTLEGISRPATAFRPSAGLAAPASRPVAEPCQDLWASGFTLPLATCLEYRQFAVSMCPPTGRSITRVAAWLKQPLNRFPDRCASTTAGGGTASWRSETVPDTEDTFVVFEESAIELSMQAVVTSGGMVIAQTPRTALSDENVSFFLSGSHPYVCTPNTLTVFGGDLPPVTFTRIRSVGEGP